MTYRCVAGHCTLLFLLENTDLIYLHASNKIAFLQLTAVSASSIDIDLASERTTALISLLYIHLSWSAAV